jgi:signal transduction histidine kinase/ActR/RegA family two-component response regulator
VIKFPILPAVLGLLAFLSLLAWLVWTGFQRTEATLNDNLNLLLHENNLSIRTVLKDEVQRLEDLAFWVQSPENLASYNEKCTTNLGKNCLTGLVSSVDLSANSSKASTVNCGQNNLLGLLSKGTSKSYKIGSTIWMPSGVTMAPIAHVLPNGSGWIAACIKLDTIRDVWRNLNLPRKSSMALVRASDYHLWIREPFKPDLLGRDLSDGPLVAAMRDHAPSPHGTAEIIATKTDFVARTVKWNPIGIDDLVLVAGYPKNHVYNTWLDREWVHLSTVGSLSFILTILATLSWTAIQRKYLEAQQLTQQIQEREAHLRVSNERLELATKAGGFGVWDLDVVTDHLEWDDRMIEMYGLTPETFPGAYEAWASALHPEDASDAEASLKAALAGEKPFDTEFRIRLPDSSIRTIRGAAVVLRNELGEPIRMIGYNQDITRSKELEHNLLEAKASAEAANAAKSEFLSSMSHELRTPMNAILGFAQMLEYNPKEPLTSTQKSYVDLILRGGNHLLELIDQVLELSKIETGHLSLSVDYTPVREVIDNSLNLIQLRADRENIKIIDQVGRDDLPLLWTDSTRLTQVLLNLLSNAVKYNRENGTVTLTCKEMPGRMLRISIADTGRGIPLEKQDLLFIPFERLDMEAGAIEGTGIGLTITKQIIELLGGHIGFESVEDKGSTFWVDVPMSEKQGIDAANVKIAITGKMNKKKAEEGSQYSVLYVEDNPANIQLMEVMIRQIGNTKLLTAYNAEQGLDIARSEKPDLILMDINLPGMNGIEALEKLQDTSETRNTPVIAISTAIMPKDVETGLKAGFRNYITKPIKVPAVITIIEETLHSIDKPD